MPFQLLGVGNARLDMPSRNAQVNSSLKARASQFGGYAKPRESLSLGQLGLPSRPYD